MSDYMFMLESHLSAGQSQVVRSCGGRAQANISLFLTGGVMRDMLERVPDRQIDFTPKATRSNSPRLSRRERGASFLSVDENRKIASLLFRAGYTRQSPLAKTGEVL